MKYRKKPVVIEAFQNGVERPPTWFVERIGKEVSRKPMEWGDHHQDYSIQTLEGSMVATFGDWIIKGIKGELYPCKPDIFEATCEAVVE
jgi:hypothetical protein